MPELYDTRAPNPPSRAILVGVKLRDNSIDETEESLQELRQLAETAGIKVVYETIQPRNRPNPTYFIGEGKVQEELKPLVEELNADAVIFDEELSPAQNRNLERVLEVATIDRTGLILQVFAQRALTKEARLQVALAQLEYALPRLTRMWTHLSRLATGGGGSRRLRGPAKRSLKWTDVGSAGTSHMLEEHSMPLKSSAMFSGETDLKKSGCLSLGIPMQGNRPFLMP